MRAFLQGGKQPVSPISPSGVFTASPVKVFAFERKLSAALDSTAGEWIPNFFFFFQVDLMIVDLQSLNLQLLFRSG